MALNAPTQIVFLISLVIAVIGLLMYFGLFLAPWAFWTVVVAYVVLAAGCVLKGA